MKICTISDSHMHHKKIKLPACDLVIHAGDFSYHGELEETKTFLEWYGEQMQCRNKVLILGNHEKFIGKQIPLLKDLCENNGITLLHNSGVTIDGFRIWGSPYSVEFGAWAFGLPDMELQTIWDGIDLDTDILVTHGGAYGVLDKTMYGENVGSHTLRNHLRKLSNLKLHVVAHIHESRGCHIEDGLLTINASICGIPYTDVLINPITVVISK